MGILVYFEPISFPGFFKKLLKPWESFNLWIAFGSTDQPTGMIPLWNQPGHRWLWAMKITWVKLWCKIFLLINFWYMIYQMWWLEKWYFWAIDFGLIDWEYIKKKKQPNTYNWYFGLAQKLFQQLSLRYMLSSSRFDYFLENPGGLPWWKSITTGSGHSCGVVAGSVPRSTWKCWVTNKTM